MIRVFIADDHEVVREGIRRIIAEHDDVEIVDDARNGEEVLARAPESTATVLLLDLTMPGPGFLDILQGIRDSRPDLRVLVLSVHDEEVWAPQVLRAGAAGYLSKNHSGRELVAAIRRVDAGNLYVSPSMTQILARQLTGADKSNPSRVLSSREMEVLRRLGSGQGPKAIASELGISPKTVSTYRARIMEKLGLRNNAELVRYVMKHQLAQGRGE